METKQNISNKARDLKTTNPIEAYQLCLKMWNEYREEFNNYDATLTIGLARKVPDTDFNLIFEIIQGYPDDSIVLGNGGWYLFDKFIKNREPYEITNDLTQIESFLDRLKQKNLREDDSYPCPFTISIFNVIDALANNMFNASRIMDFLNRLNPNYLSKKEDSYEHKTRGEIVKSSPFEKYYALKIKALEKMAKYEDCLQACNEALEKLEEFHYDNKLWITMRKALSLEHLGQHDESELLFKELISSPKGATKWFFYRDLAELYFEQVKYEKAYQLTLEAALHGNDPEFLIRLYRLQAQVLFKLDRVEDGKICAELIAAILQEKGWKHREEYTRLFNYFNIDLNEPLFVKKIHRKATEFWISEKYKNQEEFNGSVSVIHKNGKSGHILSDHGYKYFFGKKDLLKSTKNLSKLLNAKVRFYEGQETDKGKKAEAVTVKELAAQEDKSNYIGKSSSGVINNIVEFGIFVEKIFNGEKGLIHKKNLKDNFAETFQVDDEVEVIVSGINKKQQLELKLKND